MNKNQRFPFFKDPLHFHWIAKDSVDLVNVSEDYIHLFGTTRTPDNNFIGTNLTSLNFQDPYEKAITFDETNYKDYFVDVISKVLPKDLSKMIYRYSVEDDFCTYLYSTYYTHSKPFETFSETLSIKRIEHDDDESYFIHEGYLYKSPWFQKLLNELDTKGCKEKELPDPNTRLEYSVRWECLNTKTGHIDTIIIEQWDDILYTLCDVNYELLGYFYDPFYYFQKGDDETYILEVNKQHLVIYNDGDVHSVLLLLQTPRNEIILF